MTFPATWRWLAWLQIVLFLPLCMIPMRIPLVREWWRIELFGWDKLAHALFFWVLGVLLAAGWRRNDLRLGSARTAVLIIGLGMALGILGEVIQHFLPWRQGLDLDDGIADLVGCLLAWISLPLLARVLPPIESFLGTKSKA